MSKNRAKIDINALLVSAGYSARGDFAQVARWASSQRFKAADQVLPAVAKKFGPAQAAPAVGMRDQPAPFQAFLPGGLQTNAEGQITSYFEQVQAYYPSREKFKEVKEQTESALEQLVKALRLPVASRGAVMPDVHVGYAMPIGGVVALENAVSPAFVGYDIGCRMHLSLFKPEAVDPQILEKKKEREHFMEIILDSSSFGVGASRAETPDHQVDHPVMDQKLWDEIPALRKYKRLARKQLGTQGAGNHFCDLVELEVLAEHPDLPAIGTRLLALLTHSGSRGVGNELGHIYARLAEEETAAHNFKLSRGYGFLLLDTEAGQEYWNAMELMGAYAQANHQIVHAEFARNAGLASSILKQYENHHNFAWKENGLIVHRKGATPANLGQIGIIPGSSGTDSYLVEGLGNPASLFSASHGAGRPYSRAAARAQHDPATFQKHMQAMGISSYGIAPDETYAAYKDIDEVMAAQRELVRPLARMRPRVVVMGGNSHSDDGE
jgi:tRNA-splicing ligase RtcB (3'-phosphate/5'-hydroxy nucleic acid ligase)